MKTYPLKFDHSKVAETLLRIKTVAGGGIPDRVPMFYGAYNIENKPWPKYDPFDDEKELEWQVVSRQRSYDLFPEGDCFPWIWAGTAFSQAIVPSLFGAEVVIEDSGVANIRGRLIHDLSTDLDRLPKQIDPEKDGLAPRLRRRIEYFRQATNAGIMPFDWQSPYGVACLLMSNEDLMMAMYDTPELVHELFRRVTQAIIDLIRAAQNWIGDADMCVLNNQMFFKGSGMTLHDDYVSVLSPDLHGQFCYPCNLKLYQEFGYGHLHTCGPVFPGYIDALLKHKGLLSLDISPYMRGTARTQEDLMEFKRRTHAAGITMTGNPTVCPRIGATPERPLDREWFETMAGNGGLILNWFGGTREYGLQLLEWCEEVYRKA